MDVLFVLILFAPAIPTVVCTVALYKQRSDWLSPERYWSIRFSAAMWSGVVPAVLLAVHPYAFGADWKSRGNHWAYYLNDGPAGTALLPLYAVGAISACVALLNVNYARTSLLNLLLLSTNLLICVWYTFTSGGLFTFPLTVGIFYGFLLAMCFAHRELPADRIQHAATVVGWVCGIAGSIAYKIQAAKAHYLTLPDEGCFVVTAAARGHNAFVGSWTNPNTGLVENAQLQTLRQFEALVRERSPRGHVVFRAIYNRVGPPIAGSVVFRWQADLMFVALKPVELAARAVIYLARR